eukprot:5651332-Amphidinium_carterae.1
MEYCWNVFKPCQAKFMEVRCVRLWHWCHCMSLQPSAQSGMLWLWVQVAGKVEMHDLHAIVELLSNQHSCAKTPNRDAAQA